jgi:NAD(P)-dependent dehydrogenase (short-subunit alcohol dehydrogenase family)
MKTVLITGCSSGYGLETARYFLSKGCQVVATMRTPRGRRLPKSQRLRVLALDVTGPREHRGGARGERAHRRAREQRGIGLFGAFEATPMATTREVFETNTFGVMAMTQAVIPQFRARRSGVVVNVTVERDAGPDAVGGGVHRKQDGHRRLHRVARSRACGVRRQVKLVEPGTAPRRGSPRTAASGWRG